MIHVPLPSHDLSKRVEFQMSLYLYLGSWFCSVYVMGRLSQGVDNVRDKLPLMGKICQIFGGRPARLPGLLL